MTKKQRALEIINRLKTEYPDADCTLDYDQAWKLLVSVRLAAQCTDARVNVVVEKLYEKFPDVESLAQADPDAIETIVKPCGLGHSKARDISACMKILWDQYGGKVPDDFDALLKLPGVGRKSANLIMGDVFGKPAIVTDTHCIRLVNRMGLVDALRLQSEFSCGDDLTRKGIDEEDIENLIIQQIEFCNIILLNKAAEVQPEELKRIKQIIRTLQPGAEIIECNYADVDLDKIIHTHLFNFERAATSAGWIRGIEQQVSEEEEKEAHYHHEEGHHHHHEDEHHHESEHHHEKCHHHHHEGGEVEEYGIGTFVYYRRPAFDIHKFDHYVATKWPRSVIRAKGVCYFSHNRDMSFLFEQAGIQKKITEAGQWYATAPEEDMIELMRQEPGLLRDWDEQYGDRMLKIVFIGQNMDKEQIIRDLDKCLE